MSNHHAFQYFGMTSSTEADQRPVLTSSLSSPSIFSSPHYSAVEDQLAHQHYDGHYHQSQPLQIDVGYAQQQPQSHDPQTAPGSANEPFYDMDGSNSTSFDDSHYHQQQHHPSQQSHILAPSSSASSSRHGEESSSSSAGGLGAALGGSSSGGSHNLLPAGLPSQDTTRPTSASTSTTSGGRTSIASLTKSVSRARVNMACMNCRSRKIRCDGDQPTCSTCKRLNRPCHYESISEEENTAVRERKRKSREMKQARLNALSTISVGPAPLGRRQYDQPPHSAHFTGGMGMMQPSASKMMEARRHSASSSLAQFGNHAMPAQYAPSSAAGPSVLRDGRGGGGLNERHSPYAMVPPHRQPMYPNSTGPPPLPSPALSQATSSPVQSNYAQAPFHPQPYPQAPPQRSWQSQVPPSSPASARYGSAPQQSVRRRADTVGGYDDYSRGPHDQVLAWRGQLSSSSGETLLHGDLAAMSSNATAYEMIPAHSAPYTSGAPQPPTMMGMSQPATPDGSYHLQGPGPPMLAYEYNSGGGHGGGGSVDHSPGNHDLQFLRWSGGGGGAQPPPN